MLKQRMSQFKTSPSARAWGLLLLMALLYGVARWALWTDTNTPSVSIGSKNFTESLIVGELYAQALEQANFKVARKFNLGGTFIAHEALKRGDIDLYPEYTGTGLVDVLHATPPKTPQATYEAVAQAYRARWKIIWLNPSAVNNTQALVVTRKTAERYHLYTLSRLAAIAPQLVLASIPEFEEREDGLKGLQHYYQGFRFKAVNLYANGLKYQVLRYGNADVSVAFSTDGALSDPNFVLLQDDRAFWPAYQLSPIVRAQTASRYPKIATILNQISTLLDNPTLQRLNQQVDIKKQDYRTVARTFLEAHLLKPDMHVGDAE